jgi:Protein of unknown function (DUF3379)
MECAEFKRAAGAEPQRLSAVARDHMSRCLPCERYAQHMLSLDGLLQRALQVPVVRSPAQLRRSTSTRWLALAASFLLTAIVGAGAWLVLPQMTLASELIDHVSAEQDIVDTAQPLSSSELNSVLRSSGVRLSSSPEHQVWYVMACPFRGKHVPHLVVQTTQGRVAVLLLSHVRVRSVQRFDEQGYRGTILPSGPGSVAVIATNQEAVEEATQRVAAAVTWTK